MADFPNENVIEDAVHAFSETIALKVKQLRRYVPKAKKLTNPDVTGAYMEEVVRGFIRDWIGNQQFLHGTFYSKSLASSQPPLQIDGIVYDATKGPPILREGGFVLLHPAFCSGVVEVKASIPSIKTFEQRLRTVHGRYLRHLPSTQVMGIVISDKNPEKISNMKLKDGRILHYYNHYTVPLCPIFVLFKESGTDYEPFTPGIDSMIRAVHNLVITTNYLG